MKFYVQLILVVSTTVQISCRGSQFIQMPLSWFDANQFCKDQNSSLACITPEDISNTNLQDGQKFWIPTHTTFSSWIKHAGYIIQEPSGVELVIPEDDIFTCQLLCPGFKHFIVNTTKCLCFSDHSKIHQEGLMKAYESVNESEINAHISKVLQKPCEYYICTEQFSTPFLIPDGVDDECFTPDRYLVICSSAKVETLLEQQCEPLKNYLLQVRPSNVECKLFFVKYSWYNADCGYPGQGQGKGCNVAVETGETLFVKGTGLTSFLNQDKTIISCYSGISSTNNNVQTMEFGDTVDCNFSSNFFCEKDVQKLGLCELNRISTRRGTADTTSAQPFSSTGKHQFENRTDTSSKQQTTQEVGEYSRGTAQTTSAQPITTGKNSFEDRKDTSTNGHSTRQGGKNLFEDGTYTSTNEQSTLQDERTTLQRRTDTHMASGVAIGVPVSISVLVFVLLGILLLVYCWRIKKKMLKQNQSNEFSFRNIAYESNPSNNNEGINEPSINGAVYDYIRENEYATISSDFKENGANKDAGYTHHNREIFPKPSHLRKQDSHYTAIGKSGKNNVYNKLVYRNKPEKDSQSICKECGKKHQTKLQNSERVQSSASCCVKSFDGMSGFNKDNLNSKGNDYLILEPEPEYSMASAMAKTSSISSNSHNKHTKEQIGLYEKALPIQNNENKKSQNSINNYFTLEKIDNGQNDQSDREGEYVDSNENDYDHLHKKRQKGSQDHDHLYAHTCHDTKNDIAYDTAGAFLTRPCIDNTDYDTMLNVTKGITDA